MCSRYRSSQGCAVCILEISDCTVAPYHSPKSPLSLYALSAMAEQGDTILQFVPFVSRLETGFWHELGRRKLEKYKLSEEQQDIHGCYYNSESSGRLRAVASCAHARKVSLATRSLYVRKGCSMHVTAIGLYKPHPCYCSIQI